MRGSLKKGEWLQVTLIGGEWSCLMEGEWSCYRGGYFNGGRMVMLQVVTLMEGEWSCYRGGQFNGGRMIMLWRWPL